MINNENYDAIGGTACIITGGLLSTVHAKTAHGLIRQSDRFKIVGIIDYVSAGRDAGDVLDGKNRNIPIFKNVEELLENIESPKYAIIGMATKGGVLPQELYPGIINCLKAGINLVNGLHEALGEIPEFKEIAAESGARIYDIRKPKPFKDLHFWTGNIKEVQSLKIGVLGTDCALGKRTTSKLLVNELKNDGFNSHMIYTGQTGWLQGGKYGFIFDSTPNDFISGELEHAVYQCWQEEKPDVMILEGQSGLRNPSGPCGSEYIISCALDGVILQHDPMRRYFKGIEDYGKEIPSVKDEIALIKMLGADTICITLNTASLDAEQAVAIKNELEKECGIPVVIPLFEGVGTCATIIKNLLKK